MFLSLFKMALKVESTELGFTNAAKPLYIFRCTSISDNIIFLPEQIASAGVKEYPSKYDSKIYYI